MPFWIDRGELKETTCVTPATNCIIVTNISIFTVEVRGNPEEELHSDGKKNW